MSRPSAREQPLDGADVTELLGSLVSKSLVESSIDGDTVRHRLLETVRAYAADRLTLAGEAEALRDAHHDRVLARLEAESWDTLLALDASEIPTSLPDLRAALTWSHVRGRLDLVGRLFARTTSHWDGMNLIDERKRWNDVLAPIESELGPDERTLLLLNQLSDARAERRMRSTIVVADRAVAVAANGACPVVYAHALITRSYLRTIGGSIASDRMLIEQAEHDIAQAIELVDGLSASHAAQALSVQGLNRMITGDLTGASASLSAAIERSATHMARSSVRRSRSISPSTSPPRSTCSASRGVPRRSYGRRSGRCRQAPRHWGRVGTIAAIMGGVEPLAATERLLDSYDAVRQSPFDGSIEEWLTGAAAVIMQMGDVDTGARLLSWVRSVTLDRGLPTRSPASYLVYRRYVALAHDTLTPDAAHLAHAAGGELTNKVL